MKLKFIFALLIALIFGSTVRAVDGLIDEPVSTITTPETSETKPNSTENQKFRPAFLNRAPKPNPEKTAWCLV